MRERAADFLQGMTKDGGLGIHLIRPSVRTGAPSPQGEGVIGDGGISSAFWTRDGNADCHVTNAAALVPRNDMRVRLSLRLPILLCHCETSAHTGRGNPFLTRQRQPPSILEPARDFVLRPCFFRRRQYRWYGKPKKCGRRAKDPRRRIGEPILNIQIHHVTGI